MKRYLLFSWTVDSDIHGWETLDGWFDTVKQAHNHLKIKDLGDTDIKYQIVDTSMWEILEKGKLKLNYGW